MFFSYAIVALSCYAAGDYVDAAQWVRRSAQDLLRVDPSLSSRCFADGHAFKELAMRRQFSDHLIKAGLPE